MDFIGPSPSVRESPGREGAAVPGGAVHVVMKDRRWVVVREGVTEPDSAHDRKIDAVAAGARLAEREAVSLVVFTLDGRRDARFQP
jgi:hypothetical protein